MTTRQPSATACRLGTLGLALLAGSMPVFAQSLVTPHTYIGASIGRTSADFDRARFIATPALSSYQDEHDTGYKLYAGWQFNRNFAVEAGYHDLGRYNFGYTAVPGTFAGNTRFRGGHLDLVAGWPVMDRLTVFGRLGANWTRARTNVATTGVVPALGGSRSESGWGPKLGLGLEYAMTPSLAVRAEWERYRVRDAIRGRDNIDMASIGLVYRFGAPAVVATRAVASPPPPPPPVAPPPPPVAAPMAPPPPPPVAPPPPPAPTPAPAPRPYRN